MTRIVKTQAASRNIFSNIELSLEFHQPLPKPLPIHKRAVT